MPSAVAGRVAALPTSTPLLPRALDRSWPPSGGLHACHLRYVYPGCLITLIYPTVLNFGLLITERESYPNPAIANP